MSPELRRPPAVARVLQKVTATARRHDMLRPGERVVVAVSGGPDSLCLLHSIVRLRRLFEIDPVCFHFDHALREGSRADAAYVRRQAGRLGVPFVLRRADAPRPRGSSPEAWARTVRYRALIEVIGELGGGVAAVGHTADDQAETVLLALLRGSGPDALAGMAPVAHPVVRPLLEVSREETVGFCRSLGLRPRRDPMNEDPALMRAALRKRVLPDLERRLGRGVRDAVVRSALLLREDAAFLEELADRAEAEVVAEDDREVWLRSDALASLPGPVASRVARRALLRAGALPEAATVAAVRDLAAGRPGRRVSLPGALNAERDREYVRLSRSSPG